MTDAEFIRFLADRGLTAVSSAETLHDLRRRYGVRRWFGFADVITLPPASLFAEQTEPFFMPVNRTCLLPPGEFECDFDFYRDAQQTHACALERLTASFGTPERGQSVNTLEHTWRFERMSLCIRTFLREKTRSRSDLYVKHPELWDFCRISIDRNWVRPVTESEANALHLLGPDAILPVRAAVRPAVEHPFMWERGLFRLSPSGTIARPGEPFLWKRDADIGWCAGVWAAMFDRNHRLELRLERVAPERGDGYSRLMLRLPNPFSLEREPVDTVVLAGEAMNSLDRIAPDVAALWKLRMKTEEFKDD